MGVLKNQNKQQKIEEFFNFLVKMFDTVDWDEEIPKKSEKNVISSLKRKIEKSISSPSLTQNLIDDTPEKAKKAKTENILTKGIKFASEQDFLGFLNSRDKKSEKRKLKKSESKSSEQTPKSSEQKPKLSEQKPKSSEQKPKSSEQKPKSSEQKPKSSEQTPKSLEQKPKSDQKFKVSKLKELFK